MHGCIPAYILSYTSETVSRKMRGSAHTHTHCSEHTRLLQVRAPGMADDCRVKSLAVKLAEIEFSQDMLQLGI